LTLDQGGNLTARAPEQQVALPMTGHCPIFHRGRALADRYGVKDSSVVIGLLRVMARTAHDPRASQMLQQFLLQGPTGLDKEAAIDGLV
jgi:hypothetical protein